MANLGDVLSGTLSWPAALAGVIVTGVVAVMVAARDPDVKRSRVAPEIEWAEPDRYGGYVVGA